MLEVVTPNPNMNEVHVPAENYSAGTGRASQWHAFLNLRFAQTTRGVRLVEKAHAGPLYIQKPFYPEGLDLPHIYLLHPPGGLVSGDELKISVEVEAHCKALLTTPGAGRLYKARDDGTPQKQALQVTLAENGVFEYLPLEAIAFPNTNAQLDNSFHLEKGAKLIYWDVLSLGLPANKLAFDSGRFNQNTKIYRQGRLVLQERFIINEQNRRLLNEQAGLQDNPVQGLCIAGPFADNCETLVNELNELITSSGTRAGVSRVDQFIIIRTLNQCSEVARDLLEQCWAKIRPALIAREACAPRIWRT